MKILHIVPEFEEGGVERYVLQLSGEQINNGHEVTLATAGGKLERFLPPEVKVIHLPVQRKNLFTVLYSAKRLAKLNDGWDIIHAHSRVPAWVAWILSVKIKTKWVMTLHAQYSHNLGLIPLRHADGAMCVSDAVRTAMKDYLPENNITIPNGINEIKYKWCGKKFPDNKKFLCVGRLTRKKAVDVILKALGSLKNYEWTLDILGDGAQREELENLATELKIDNRVKFWGFRDDSEKFMSEAACLLFPSRSEGVGLVVLEALTVGLPVLASDLEPLRPYTLPPGNLIPVDDVDTWRENILRVINGGAAGNFSTDKIISFKETARRVEKFYLKTKK